MKESDSFPMGSAPTRKLHERPDRIQSCRYMLWGGTVIVRVRVRFTIGELDVDDAPPPPPPLELLDDVLKKTTLPDKDESRFVGESKT